jgi:beta-lactamase class A
MRQKRTKKKGGRNKNKRTKKNKKTNKKLSPPRPLTLALKPSHTLEFTSTERQLVDAVNKLIKLLPTLFPKEFFNKRLLPSSAADQLRLMQTVINNVKSPKFLKGLAETKLLTGQTGGGPGRFFKSPLLFI